MRLATLSHLERWRLAPPKNASQIRRTVHYYAKQPLFDRTVLCVIFLNLLAMVAYRTNATEAENVAQEVFDYFFTFFYVAEATLLITAMGWRMYWSNFMVRPWGFPKPRLPVSSPVRDCLSALLATFTSTRGSYKYITSALFYRSW